MSLKISIDCWGTLIKSSPAFVEAKNEMIEKLFDVSGIWIDECFRNSKQQLNNIIEITGWQPDIILSFRLLLSKINACQVEESVLISFIQNYQMLALQNSPIMYSEETVYYVKKLQELGELYISSNTIFVKGMVLEKALEENCIHDCFSGFAFSDTMGVSKPHKDMYRGSDFHIGDNKRTDFDGALAAGSKPYIINSTQKTIADAYNFIKENR